MNNFSSSNHIPRSVVKTSRQELEILKLQIHKSQQETAPLNMALTLHSTWLPDVNQGQQYTEEERRQKRADSIKLDYDDLLKDKSQLIQKLFRDIVYPNFINQTLEDKFEQILEKDSFS